MKNTFEKEVIYITGASAGIGYATAELCLQKGATVVITGRNNENLESAKNELLKISSKVIAHNVDVSNELIIPFPEFCKEYNQNIVFLNCFQNLNLRCLIRQP